MKLPTFYEVLSAAINDLMLHGFDSRERLDSWMKQLAGAAQRSLVPEYVLQNTLKSVLERTYTRATTLNALVKVDPKVSAFTLSQVKPRLRAELDRRILASASLIKLNREASIARTLQRFAGWSTSIPAGGTEAGKRAEVKSTIRRGIAGLGFEERRVIVDQGHKLVASINELIAVDGGSIAAIWKHVREGGGYQARPEHEARDGKVFLLRDSWAIRDGLVKLAGREYTDQVEQPAALPFCRCSWSFLFSLRDMPSDMLTKAGKEALLDARSKLKKLA
jgi:hypothetical protein